MSNNPQAKTLSNSALNLNRPEPQYNEPIMKNPQSSNPSNSYPLGESLIKDQNVNNEKNEYEKQQFENQRKIINEQNRINSPPINNFQNDSKYASKPSEPVNRSSDLRPQESNNCPPLSSMPDIIKKPAPFPQKKLGNQSIYNPSTGRSQSPNKEYYQIPSKNIPEPNSNQINPMSHGFANPMSQGFANPMNYPPKMNYYGQGNNPIQNIPKQLIMKPVTPIPLQTTPPPPPPISNPSIINKSAMPPSINPQVFPKNPPSVVSLPSNERIANNTPSAMIQNISNASLQPNNRTEALISPNNVIRVSSENFSSNNKSKLEGSSISNISYKMSTPMIPKINQYKNEIKEEEKKVIQKNPIVINGRNNEETVIIKFCVDSPEFHKIKRLKDLFSIVFNTFIKYNSSNSIILTKDKPMIENIKGIVCIILESGIFKIGPNRKAEDFFKGNCWDAELSKE